MAIAGGATVAYICQVVDGSLDVVQKTTLRKNCVPVGDAMVRLSYGEAVTVAGGDMADLRKKLGKAAVE